MGHFEKRRNGDGSVSWRVVVRVGYGRGARRETRVVCTTERDQEKPPPKVTAALRDLERQAEAGFIPPARVMLTDVFWRWLDNHAGLAPKTRYTYERLIQTHLEPAFERFRVVDLRPVHMQDYYATKREEGLSDATIHWHYRAIHAALRWAVESELAARNVCDVGAAKPPRGLRLEQPTLTAEQMLGVLEAVAGTELHLPVLLACATGMRRGEICALRWRDVDLKAGMVTVSASLSYVPHEGLQSRRWTDGVGSGAKRRSRSERRNFQPPILSAGSEPSRALMRMVSSLHLSSSAASLTVSTSSVTRRPPTRRR
jgi:hypothetical protein